MNALPANLQSDIEALYLHLGVAVPDAPGSGVDGFVPLIEHIKGLGGIFLIKWDGQRDTRQYTAVVSHPDVDACRADDHTIELAISRVILSLVEAILDFSDGTV